MKRKLKHVLDIPKVEPPDEDEKEKIPEHLGGKLFPGFPTTTVLVGQPGSGKTNLLIHMLTSPNFYKGFFDKVYFFGLTCKSDSLYKSVELPPEQIITDVDEFLPKLTQIIKEQQAACEANWNSADKICFVFEDLTSLFTKVQSSPQFIRCYTQIRHLKGSSFAMVHKYKAFNRTCRMCSLHVIFFKVNNTELEQLYNDFGSSYLNKKEFINLATYCLTASEESTHPFFYINLQAPEETRFRRNFTDIMKRVDSHSSKKIKK